MPLDPETARKVEAFRTAYQTRNSEIALFWQRSNYFLVLNRAIAAGFFAADSTYRPHLSVMGVVVSALWVAVNLGSKFWQTRWEYRLRLAEGDLFGQDGRKLFNANKEQIRQDVADALKPDPADGRPNWLRRLYDWGVKTKPSVSLMMTILSGLFVVFWIAALVTYIVCVSR